MAVLKNKVIFSEDYWKRFDEHIGIVVDQKLEQRLGLEPGETLDDKLKYLPTKKEFYDKEDEVLSELKKLREEVEVSNHHYKRTNKRVDLIDKHLGIITSDLA